MHASSGGAPSPTRTPPGHHDADVHSDSGTGTLWRVRTAIVSVTRSLVRSVTVAAAVALLAGCGVMSPMQTEVDYVPADGLPVDLGTVQVRNLLVVSSAKGEAGLVSAYVVNDGDNEATVTISAADGSTATATVAPHGTVTLSSEEPVRLANVDVSPGSLLDLHIGTAQSGPTNISVPVLPPTGPYESLKP